MTTQKEFRWRDTFRPVLVDLNRAAEATGYHWNVVLEMVDEGDLQWVWDFAAQPGRTRSGWCTGHRRELRFWMGELLAPTVHRDRTLDEVIKCVLGRDQLDELRAVSLSKILLLRRQQIMRMVKSGEISGRRDGHPCFVLKSSVIKMLHRRWIGAGFSDTTLTNDETDDDCIGGHSRDRGKCR